MRRWLTSALLCASLVLHGLAAAAQPANVASPETMPEAAANRYTQLALACLHQEYPNKISHVLQGDADVQAPHALTPAFFGCYDWHSAVHGHWLLVRLLRRMPDARICQGTHARLSRPASRRRTSPRKWNISDRKSAPHSSDRMGSRGCFSYPRNYVVGTIRKGGSGQARWNHSKHWPRPGSKPGCRYCITRSASVSTTRPRSRSVLSGIGRILPATMK